MGFLDDVPVYKSKERDEPVEDQSTGFLSSVPHYSKVKQKIKTDFEKSLAKLPSIREQTFEPLGGLENVRRASETTPASLFERQMQENQRRGAFEKEFPTLAKRYKTPEIAKQELGRSAYNPAVIGGIGSATLGLGEELMKSTATPAQKEQLKFASQQPEYTVGQLAGYIGPGVGASKLAIRGLGTASKGLKGMVAAEGLAGFGMGAVEGAIRGDESPIERARDYGVFGGAGTGVLGSLSKAGRSIYTGLKMREIKPPTTPVKPEPFKLGQAPEIGPQRLRQPVDIGTVDNMTQAPRVPLAEQRAMGIKPLPKSLELPQVGLKPDKIKFKYKPTKFETGELVPAKKMKGKYTDVQKPIKLEYEIPVTKSDNYDAIKTIDDLPDDAANLQKYVAEATRRQEQGIKINLQLFAEAQKRLKNRRFASKSIMEAEIIPQQMKDDFFNDMPQYEPITNKATWNKAVREVTDDSTSAYNKWKSIDKLKTADDTALGQAIMVDRIKKGDITGANEIAYDLAEKLTSAGQSVQAASILKRLSPEGMLTYVNRTLQRAERELGKKFKGKLKLTPDEIKDIADRVIRMRDMPEGRAKDIEFAEIQRVVSEKIPPTWREKLKALQRVNLLFNPKTMIRNIGGNIIMSGIKNIKDIVRTGIDLPLSRLARTERTVALPSSRAQVSGFKRGVSQTLEDYARGIDTTNVSTQFELNPYRVTSPFKSKVFKKAEELTRLGLKFGDSPFYKAAYDDAIQQQLKAKGLNKATPEIKQLAEQVAKETTFQDINEFTKFFDGMRNALNKANIKGFGLGDIALPFTKTPANILKRGVEYSPINVYKVVQDATSFYKDKSSINQFKLVDSLAKTLTGTGLLGAGYLLAKAGIITPKEPDDWDAASFQREQGILPYSIKTGDKYLSFDWAQPASITLAMGADMYKNSKQTKSLLDLSASGGKTLLSQASTISDALQGGAGTLFSQPMIQGLTRLASSYDQSGKALLNNFQEAVFNGALQLMPFNALARQTAELFDPYNRSTYDDNDFQSKLINRAMRSYPVTRNLLPQRFKTTGEAQESRNPLNIFLNPANVGTPELTETKNEILRLYDESGETIQFPRVAPKKIKPKKKGKKTFEEVTLTGEQRSEYQQLLGLETMKDFEKEMNKKSYQGLDDEERAKKLQEIINDANSDVKKDIIDKYGLRQERK